MAEDTNTETDGRDATDYPGSDKDAYEYEWAVTEARETEVADYRCVFCKVPKAEWAEDMAHHELHTGEGLCGECLRDLRYYKRVISVLIVAHDGFGPAVRQAVDRHFRDLIGEVRGLTDTAADKKILRPPHDSNARRAPNQGRHEAVEPGVLMVDKESLTEEQREAVKHAVINTG
jgi:hypothetical protein